MNAREKLKHNLLITRQGMCEAQYISPHACEGGLGMHEVLYKRNDVPKRQQDYLWEERNCVLLCHWAHMEWGQETDFNRRLALRLLARYGHEAMREYLMMAPFKVKTAYEWMFSDDFPAEVPRGARVLAVNGRESMGTREACGKPVLGGQQYESYTDGIVHRVCRIPNHKDDLGGECLQDA